MTAAEKLFGKLCQRDMDIKKILRLTVTEF